MPIELRCPKCGKGYKLQDSFAGKKVKCKCSHLMTVPQPPKSKPQPKPAPVTDPLSNDPLAADPLAADPLGAPGPDPLDPLAGLNSSMWEQSLPQPGVGAPAPLRSNVPAALSSPLMRPVATPAAPQQSAKANRKGLSKRTKLGLIIGGGTVGGIAAIGLLVFLILQATKPGFWSPQEAIFAYRENLEKEKWQYFFATYDPNSQVKLLEPQVQLAREGAAKSPEIKAVLDKHKMMTGSVSEVKDKALFFGDLMTAFKLEREKHLPNNPVARLLALKPISNARQALAKADLKNFQVDDNSAKGMLTFRLEGADEDEQVPLTLVKINGGWFIQASEFTMYHGIPMPFSAGLSLGL